jgi:hypothetical protein
MSQWRYWQSERGVLTGSHFLRDASTDTDPEEQQSSKRTHNGSARIRTLGEAGKTNATINTFGNSGKWSIACRYRLDSFPAFLTLLYLFQQSAGNNNRIQFITPGSASLSAQFLNYSSDGAIVNTYNWDLTGTFYTSDTNSRLEWMHFVVTYDSSQAAADELTFYTYGVETTPTSTTINGNTNQTNTSRFLQIGNPIAFSAVSAIHEIAVWEGVVLTSDEVKAIYNHGIRGFDLQSNRDGYESAEFLVNWFRFGFNGDSSLMLTDFLDSTLNLLSAPTGMSSTSGGSPVSPTGAFINFNGTNERFEANNGGAGRLLSIADEWTISAWVHPDGGLNLDDFIEIDDAISSGTNQIRIGYDFTGAGVGFEASYRTGGTIRTVTVAGLTDVWHHIVLSKTAGGGATIYMDGVAGTTGASLTMTDTARSISIGGRLGGVEYFNGAIHSVAIWNKAMTASEIKVVYNEGSSDLDLRRSFKGYRHACALQNWWWLGQPAQSSEEGSNQIVDRGHGTRIDMSEDATGIDRSNAHNAREFTPRGSRGCAGTFMRLDGSTETLTTNGNINVGIGNDWALNFAIRTSNVGAMATAPIIEFNAGSDINRIRIRILGALTNDPLDISTWSSTGALIKVFRWNNIIINNKWINFHLTWNGTALRLWIDGALTTQSTTITNNAGTMTSTNRQINIGSIVAGWRGDISHLAIWNTSDDILRSSNRQIIFRTPKLDYLAGVNAYSTSANLQHWWKMMSDPDTIGKNFVIGNPDLDQNTGSISKNANGGVEGF